MPERVIAIWGKPFGALSQTYIAKGKSHVSPEWLGKRFYSGKVKIVHTLDEATKSIETGDILVSDYDVDYCSDWYNVLMKAKAVILDKGPSEPYTPRFIRLGMPYITQTGNATAVLEKGQEYTIDSETGAIYKGNFIQLNLEKRLYSGRVKIVHTLDEATKAIRTGDILVTEEISELEGSEWMPAVKKTTALVLERTIPESVATACRELGIPFITQTGNATLILVSDEEYTIDYETGAIFRTAIQW